ncbi:hypothetical protein [Agromyces aerolatus]|uniref:hypothetical protein n=1 Tax=Agromyces sp. LY-1074 TaxID=3074080 RepID=UPI002860705C|nr:MULTISPECIES: hypothetical protein [unclassified Agromyces]MDR5700965.1 hypothetical protein [Agromyces sp. LY-1074]MDR5707374.1 hypothetical protein [Agromyces sp. LY-1358]
MSRHRSDRPWTLAVSLGLPLSVVGASAMAISYATLIDVARVNGMPLPELFPILIDVGTVARMISAAEFRRRGIGGSWLAYLTFSALSSLSVFANATHAIGAANLAATTMGVAVLIAATPPAALLAITHLVMRLVPVAAPERIAAEQQPARLATATQGAIAPRTTSAPVESPNTPGTMAPHDVRAIPEPTDNQRREASPSGHELDERLRAAIRSGSLPTGREVGAWMGGKSARTGQRYIAAFVKTNEKDIVS